MKKRVGLITSALLVVAFACALASCGSSEGDKSTAPATPQKSTEVACITQAEGPYASGQHYAQVTVEGYEPFIIYLDADAAPVTVSNFCSLAEDGYYNGLAFYRIQDGFCMQGGTVGNTASGNDPALMPIVGEFKDNGYDNPLASKFHAGTVGMARTDDPNSATSTFFITLGDYDAVGPSLNDHYAAFGVIGEADMPIVEQIVADHVQYATEGGMGIISDESNMPVIASITIDDLDE